VQATCANSGLLFKFLITSCNHVHAAVAQKRVHAAQQYMHTWLSGLRQLELAVNETPAALAAAHARLMALSQHLCTRMPQSLTAVSPMGAPLVTLLQSARRHWAVGVQMAAWTGSANVAQQAEWAN
jgi:hypothetical protein